MSKSAMPSHFIEPILASLLIDLPLEDDFNDDAAVDVDDVDVDEMTNDVHHHHC
jgi:hypothetical protein